MKRVVITGCSGMIGVALIRLFIKKEIEVLAIVRPNSMRKHNIPNSKYVKVVECDVAQLSMLAMHIHRKYDAFFHLAWQGTYGESRNDMYLQNENVKYTLDAVKLARDLGCDTFLGAGSQAEYGRVEGKLSYQTPARPENGYGIAKLCAGNMSRIMCEKYGIKHIWARILSVYGPFDGKHTMIMSGILAMLSGEIPKYTRGEQLWDYLYCDDAAEALYLAAERGIPGSIYCIGSGTVKPLAEYISIIHNHVNPELPIGIGELPYNEKQVMYLCADIDNLHRDTGFCPQIDFEDGIQRTINWIKEGKVE